MHLVISLPTRRLVDEEVSKVTAEARNGSFTLLPRHIDFVATLVPGILSFIDGSAREVFVAVDGGVLVKTGADVRLSSANAVRDTDLDRLQSHVEQQYLQLDESERRARTALARLEAGTVRRFMEMTDSAGG
jgi:F-type H+-transporting ATPase subunit epsilon